MSSALAAMLAGSVPLQNGSSGSGGGSGNGGGMMQPPHPHQYHHQQQQQQQHGAGCAASDSLAEQVGRLQQQALAQAQEQQRQLSYVQSMHQWAGRIASSMRQLQQQIGVQLATGGTASLATLFAQGADVMTSKTKDDDAPQAIRDTAVLTGAAITALTEKYGVDALLNRVPPAI
jgi:hypothetical protein